MEDINLAEVDDVIDEVIEVDELADLETLAAQLADALETADEGERQAALESLVEALGPESISCLKEALNVVI